MKKQQVIEHFGSRQKVANALFISRQAVFGWGEYPPVDKQLQIYYATRGKLKITPPGKWEKDGDSLMKMGIQSAELCDDLIALAKHFDVSEFDIATHILEGLGGNTTNQDTAHRLTQRIDLFKRHNSLEQKRA